MTERKLWQQVKGARVQCAGCGQYFDDGTGDASCVRGSGLCNACYLKEQVVVPTEDSSSKRKHAHYFKDVSDFTEMDTYLLIRVWNIEDKNGALHHALKKMLDAGKRGNKDKMKDIREARDSLNRYLEIEAMFADESPLQDMTTDQCVREIARDCKR